MTNAEINLALVTKLYNANMLNGSSEAFIASIIDYDKKDLKRLSGKQYRWLNDLADQASEYVFETRKQLLLLKRPAKVDPICTATIDISKFEGPEIAMQALENGSVADEAAIAAGCNCKYTNEDGITYFYKI